MAHRRRRKMSENKKLPENRFLIRPDVDPNDVTRPQVSRHWSRLAAWWRARRERWHYVPRDCCQPPYWYRVRGGVYETASTAPYETTPEKCP